jgi:hypothetical protein
MQENASFKTRAICKMFCFSPKMMMLVVSVSASALAAAAVAGAAVVVVVVVVVAVAVAVAVAVVNISHSVLCRTVTLHTYGYVQQTPQSPHDVIKRNSERYPCNTI